MIRLHRPDEADALPRATRNLLHQRTKKLEHEKIGPRDNRVEKEWNTFRRTKACGEVVNALDRFQHRKCAYREGLEATDIEHFQPKSTFPERMFDWSNLLKACHTCNHSKGDRFPNDPTTGDPLLINPCLDELATFFVISPQTGMMDPIDQSGPQHAQVTLDVLKLNREALREHRRNYHTLARYILVMVAQDIDPNLVEISTKIQQLFSPAFPYRALIDQELRAPHSDLARLYAEASKRFPDLFESIERRLA